MFPQFHFSEAFPRLSRVRPGSGLKEQEGDLKTKMGEIKGHRSLCPRPSDTVAKNVSSASHSDSSSGTTEKGHISQLPLLSSWGHETCSSQ